jgi:hypothetical protein
MRLMKLQLRQLLALSLAAFFAACAGQTYRVNAGPMFLRGRGEAALQNAGGSLVLADNQNSLSGLGLDDTETAPYLRAETNIDRHRIRVHGFGIDAEGSGTLTGDYGGLVAGSPVKTSMEMIGIAGNYGYQILRDEHYRVAVGGALGFYSLDIAARSSAGREEVDTDVIMPMPFLEVEGFFGPLTIGANAAIMAADVRDASGRYWDLEAYARFQADRFDITAGYRYLLLDAYGRATSRDFDADVDLQGIFITAGVTF